MGVKTSIFANPYLICLWKYIWLQSRHGLISERFSEDDYFEIHEKSKIGIDYIKKILVSDRKIKHFQVTTLDSLCQALNKVNHGFPENWSDFQNSQIKNATYNRASKWEIYKIGTNLSKDEQRDIRKYSRRNMDVFFNQDNIEDTILKKIKVFLEEEVKKATKLDVYKIYEFAKGNYGDCPINGTDIKLPWWEKNDSIFHVIHDDEGNVCANINLLPLKEECYEKLRQGIIDERGILAEDIFGPEEKSLVKYIYVEGLNCRLQNREVLLMRILGAFPNIVQKLTENSNFFIGAIGGTELGEGLMEGAGFEIVSNAKSRIDNINFFETSYFNILKRHVKLFGVDR